MLSKKYRLKKADIEMLKKSGLRIKSKNFSLLVTESKTDLPTRFAFVISSKVSKLATKRNKIKRMISSSIEKIYKQLKPGMSILFLVRKEIGSTDQDTINAEVLRVFQYNKLI